MTESKSPTNAENRSFVEVSPESHFPIQNLPYGVFRDGSQPPRVGVAIGERILDLSVLDQAGLFRGCSFSGEGLFSRESLNAFPRYGDQ